MDASNDRALDLDGEDEEAGDVGVELALVALEAGVELDEVDVAAQQEARERRGIRHDGHVELETLVAARGRVTVVERLEQALQLLLALRALLHDRVERRDGGLGDLRALRRQRGRRGQGDGAQVDVGPVAQLHRDVVEHLDSLQQRLQLLVREVVDVRARVDALRQTHEPQHRHVLAGDEIGEVRQAGDGLEHRRGHLPDRMDDVAKRLRGRPEVFAHELARLDLDVLERDRQVRRVDARVRHGAEVPLDMEVSVDAAERTLVGRREVPQRLELRVRLESELEVALCIEIDVESSVELRGLRRVRSRRGNDERAEVDSEVGVWRGDDGVEREHVRASRRREGNVARGDVEPDLERPGQVDVELAGVLRQEAERRQVKGVEGVVRVVALGIAEVEDEIDGADVHDVMRRVVALDGVATQQLCAHAVDVIEDAGDFGGIPGVVEIDSVERAQIELGEEVLYQASRRTAEERDG